MTSQTTVTLPAGTVLVTTKSITVKGHTIEAQTTVTLGEEVEVEVGAGADNTLPGGGRPGQGGRPDNSLPGGQGGRPDNTLPGSQPGVDNTLPGSGARPGNELPETPTPKK